MASFEDYDEFGNYIGADLGSEDEEEGMDTRFGEAPRHETAPTLEGYEEEPMQTEEAGALMEVEGKYILVANVYFLHRLRNQSPCTMLLFCTKTSNTILPPRTCMG